MISNAHVFLQKKLLGKVILSRPRLLSYSITYIMRFSLQGGKIKCIYNCKVSTFKKSCCEQFLWIIWLLDICIQIFQIQSRTTFSRITVLLYNRAGSGLSPTRNLAREPWVLSGPTQPEPKKLHFLAENLVKNGPK